MEEIVFFGSEYDGKMEYYTNMWDLLANSDNDAEIYELTYEIDESIIHNYLRYFKYKRKYKKEELYMFYYNDKIGNGGWEDYGYILSNLICENLNFENQYQTKLIKNGQLRLANKIKIKLDENGDIIEIN